MGACFIEQFRLTKKEIKKMNWEKLLEHEYHRWSYMIDTELERRLHKITNAEKLRAFQQVAEVFKNSYLATQAALRMSEIGIWETAPKGATTRYVKPKKVITKYTVTGRVTLPTRKEERQEESFDRYLDI
jgi:hypothetical protein